jgi:hypothetical protein
MSHMSASFASGAAVVHADDAVTAQAPIAVYNCSRLGRVANPPSFSFTDWFRFARRR